MHTDHMSAKGSIARGASDRLAMHLRAMSIVKWQPLPHQIPPPGDWRGWLLLAGRGAGKTDACAKYITDGADSDSATHWEAALDAASRSFGALFSTIRAAGGAR